MKNKYDIAINIFMIGERIQKGKAGIDL